MLRARMYIYLTAVEVVSLWASLAVPPNHRVDRCAKEVGCGPAQVKESRFCTTRDKLDNNKTMLTEEKQT